MNSSRLLGLCIMVLWLALVFVFTGGHLWAADDEIIIDNGDTGTTQSGIWTSSTAPNSYEGDSVYAYGSRTNPPTYTWQAIVPRRGTYNVYLWWTVYQDANGNTNRSANVPVDIQDRNGTYRVTVNQRKDGGQWNKLGTFTFDTIGTVTLTANTYGYTFSADAVRFEYVYDDTVTIDNGDPGTTASGTWSESLAANPYGADSYYAGGSSTDPPTYTWQAALPQRGTYNVYMWWTVYRDTNQNTYRSDSVPVDIQDRNGTQQVIINQQQGEGQWNLIGTYSFDTMGTVTLYANADGYNYSADAVRFEYVPDDTVTIDNGDAGTAQSGTWSPSIGTDPYGGDSVYAGGSSTNPPVYTWQAALPQRGTYNVYLWWTVYRDASGNTNRSASVPVDIEDSTGIYRVMVNQQESGGQWIKLGAFSFDTTGTVTLTANAAGDTFSADAVRFVYVPDDEVVINNGDTGTTLSGDWYESYGPNPFEVDSYYAAGSSTNSPTYTWQTTLPEPGTYNVYMWWTVYRDANGNTNRSATVPVSIQHRTGTQQLTINQQEGGGQWNKLGTFAFDSAGTVTLTANAAGYHFSADAVKFVLIPDTTPPTGTISINGGAASTRSTAVTLTLSCSDNSSGCTQMQFSNDGTSWSAAEPYTTSKGWTLSPVDGTKTVQVKYKDATGNWSSVSINDSILLDTTSPTVAASPSGGTYPVAQSVTLTCSDGTGSGCTQIYYTTDGSTPTTSSSVYSSAINISAPYTKLQYFAKDMAGNPEVAGPEHIGVQEYYIGNTPPVAVIDSISPNPATAGQTVTFTGQGTDSDGTITGYNWRSSLDGQLSTSASFNTASLAAGNHTIYFKVQDNAGVWSTEATSSLVITPSGPSEDISVIRQDCTGYSPSNRCFQSLAAWQTAFGNISFTGCTTGDLTCVNKIAVARIEGTWTNADTTALTLTGWTTDSSRYVRIYTAPEARHQGKWNNTGAYRLVVSNNTPLTITDGHVRIEGLQVRVYSVNEGSQPGIHVEFPDSNGEVQISSTIVRGYVNNAYNYHHGIEVSGTGGSGKVKLWNNIVYDFQTSAVSANCLHLSAQNLTIYAYNNTLYNCNKGIAKSYPSVLAKNNIAQGCANSGFSGTFATGSDYNISNFSDAPGTNSKNSVTVQFVDSANRDLHLSSTDTVARDAGVSLSADPYLAFSSDVEGALRPSGTAWDIGADEVDVTLPTGTISINGGASSTRSTAVTLTLSCSDDSSGCAQMQFSNDGTSWSTAETYATTKAWALTAGDGSKTVYVKYKDAAGNWSSVSITDTILLDTTSPTASASPSGGTYPVAQSVALSCSDGTGSGCAQIYYTTDGSTPTTSSNVYSSAINIAASTTLKFFAKDMAGNPDPVGSEHIVTQTYTIGNTLPVAVIDSISPSPATTGQTVTFTGHGTDSDGTIIVYNWRSSLDGQLSTSASFETAALSVGEHTIYFKVQDNKGAWSTEASQALTMNQGISEDVSVIRQDCTGYSPSNRCFTSLAAWEAAFGNINFTGCTTGDLTCVNKIAVARIEGTWTNPDTAALLLDGWTTDSSRYVRIYTAPEARHQGKWNTSGAYRLEVSNAIPLDIMDGHVRIEGLQVRLSGVNANGQSGILVDFPDVVNGEVHISNTLVKGPGSTTTYNYHNGIEVYKEGGTQASGVVKLWNNIVYDFQTSATTSSCLHLSAADFTVYAYNNTLYNCKKGLYQSNPVVLAKNNIAQGCTANGFSGAFATGSDYNISNFADAPGANSKNSATVRFVDSANRDFHL
ncbi:MAG: chitobiase/beta-hexosaminidase C-terminal domain-containing protein, partial [Alphaproteobacteria bacterium]|nr:chitobiase/beta-hexosaminidase C-terminal domain-containing protein [Candidatus Nitrobium versatile]